MTVHSKTGDPFSPLLLCANQFDTLENQDEFGFLARTDIPRRPFKLPFNWKYNPLRDENWMFLVSSWRVMDTAIVRYFEKGQPEVLQRIHDIAVDWGRYHKENTPNQWTWHNMAVGIRALRLAFLLQCEEQGKIVLDPIIRDMASDHIENLMIEELVAMNNHGIFQMVGLLALARWAPDPVPVRAFGQRKLSEIARASFTRDGIHREHSPGYHRFVYKTFTKFRPFFSAIPELDRLIRSAAMNEQWLTMPDGFLAAVGDTDNGAPGRPFTTVTERDTANVGGKTVALKFFKIGGYAVCRSMPNDPKPFSLFIAGAKFNLVHKHADDLSFIFYRDGEPIFIDPGKFAYVYSETRNYFLGAEAHSTVSIEGESFAPDFVDKDGSSIQAVEVEDDRVVFSGEVIRPGLFTQARNISFKPATHLEITDVLTSSKERAYKSRLHVHPSVTASVAGNGVLLTTPQGQKLHVSANRPIEIAEGKFSPSYNKVVPCPVLIISGVGETAQLKWTVEVKTPWWEKLRHYAFFGRGSASSSTQL